MYFLIKCLLELKKCNIGSFWPLGVSSKVIQYPPHLALCSSPQSPCYRAPALLDLAPSPNFSLSLPPLLGK